MAWSSADIHWAHTLAQALLKEVTQLLADLQSKVTFFLTFKGGTLKYAGSIYFLNIYWLPLTWIIKHHISEAPSPCALTNGAFLIIGFFSFLNDLLQPSFYTKLRKYYHYWNLFPVSQKWTFKCRPSFKRPLISNDTTEARWLDGQVGLILYSSPIWQPLSLKSTVNHQMW